SFSAYFCFVLRRVVSFSTDSADQSFYLLFSFFLRMLSILYLSTNTKDMKHKNAAGYGIPGMACLLLLLSFSFSVNAQQKEGIPDWAQLDARPIPTWFQDAKFGIFIHWG